MNHLDNFVLKHQRSVGLFSLSAAVVLALPLLYKSVKQLGRLITPSYNLIERYGKGSYAVISACTDGIGKGFAISLAKRGFNLIMLIRNKLKGEALAQEIKTNINSNIDIRIVEIDFLEALTPGVIQAAVDQIKDLDISLLVNNVGMYLRTLSYEKYTEQEVLNMIAINIGSQALLTNKLISQMRKRSVHKSGVINLSSIGKVAPIACFQIYGACKSFNDYFSRSLREEYKGDVDFLSVRPGWVATPMTKGLNTFLEITPDQCAESSLKELGRSAHTPGHWKHYISTFMQKLLVISTNKKLLSIVKIQRDQ